MNKDNPIITESELLAEINKFKEDHKRIRRMTDEQYDTILLLLKPPNRIYWPEIKIFWEKKEWGEITWEALYQRYRKEKRLREIVAETY